MLMEKNMEEQKIFNGDYELRMFCSLPIALKDKIIDLEGKSVPISDIDPLSLVCVQISNNPGIKPYIIQQDKTTFDLFYNLAKQRGFSIDGFHQKLKQSISSN